MIGERKEATRWKGKLNEPNSYKWKAKDKSREKCTYLTYTKSKK